MHLYLLTRGIKHDVDRFITELQGKYLPYEYEKGKIGQLQFSVRPVQLWEMVFPEPQLQTVLASIQPSNGFGSYNETYQALLRKTLGLSKIPEIVKDSLIFPIYKENIGMTALGIKPDRIREIGSGKEGPVGEGCEVI
jgi:hypothetical protein